MVRTPTLQMGKLRPREGQGFARDRVRGPPHPVTYSVGGHAQQLLLHPSGTLGPGPLAQNLGQNPAGATSALAGKKWSRKALEGSLKTLMGREREEGRTVPSSRRLFGVLATWERPVPTSSRTLLLLRGCVAQCSPEGWALATATSLQDSAQGSPQLTQQRDAWRPQQLGQGICPPGSPAHPCS